MDGFRRADGLTGVQLVATQTVVQAGIDAGLEPQAMLALLEEHVALLDEASPDDSSLAVLAEDLANWVRWYRAPALYLTDVFQRVTQRRGSPIHVTACLLFADAQMGCANDMAFHSTEVAWRALRATQASGTPMPPDQFEQQQQTVLHRLRTQYRFYSLWARPFPYMECNPLTETMYERRILRDLREAYPDPTDQLSSSMPPADRAAVLLATAELARSQEDTYHSLTGRHLAANDLVLAEQRVELYRSCLAEARAVGLEAEIGHLLRSLGWNLMMLGQLPEAAAAMEASIEHEKPVSLFAYWAALSARELGQIRDRMGRADALDAFRYGRALLDGALVGGGPPVAATIKRQMVRSYADNALITALLHKKPQDALAEIEASGPRSIGETLAEVRAAGALPKGHASEFIQARTVFHRHLTSIPSTFDGYLADMDAEYASRRLYMQERQSMVVLPERSSDEVAGRLLTRPGDDRLILAFALWPSPTSCAVLLDLADGSLQWVVLGNTELALRRAHHDYVDEIAEADDLVGSAATQARGEAVRHFCAAVQTVVEPALTLLSKCAKDRRLVVVPQMQLHAVPFSALTCAGTPILDVVADLSFVPTLDVLANLLEREQAPTAGLTAFHNSKVPLYEGCLQVLIESRNSRVIRDPSSAEALAAVQSAAGDDVFFACHGFFEPDAPAASHLRVGPGAQLTLDDLMGSVMLPSCRNVVLGACESGLARAELGSEYIGLAGALLGAGVSCVVASLWSVDQVASSILLSDLITCLGKAPDVPAALAQAQRRLRLMSGGDVAQWLAAHLPEEEELAESYCELATPFDHSLYWSGFAVYGVGLTPENAR